MSAAIISFPDEKARELLLNGYYRPQDVRQSDREKLLSWADRVGSQMAAYEAESREYSKRRDAMRAAGVPRRCLWSLAANGYSTLEDLARLNVNVLDKARNVGPKSIRELKVLLLNNGINLDPSWEEWEDRQAAREG